MGGCSEVPPDYSAPIVEPTPMPMPDDTLGEFQQEMLDAINDVRAVPRKCGNTMFPSAGPVGWDYLLEQAAQRHSTDMFDNGFFSHEGSDGTNASHRVSDTGYEWLSIGENIAFGFATIDGVINGWLSSPGHCANIMSPYWQHMGVSKVDKYWTQVFGLPLEVYNPEIGL